MKHLLIILLSCLLLNPCWARVNFDGTSDWITGETGISLGSNFTVSVWLRLKTPATFRDIWSLGDSTNSKEWVLETDSSAGRKLFLFAINVTGSPTAPNTDDELFGNRVNIIVVNNSGTFTIYRDGIAQSVTGTEGDGFTATRFFLGSRGSDLTSRECACTLSDLAIWDVALSQSEIELISDSRIKGMPLQIQTSNLQAYLPLDDHPHNDTVNSADGLVFKDRSSNTNDGTASGCNAQAEEVLSYP